MSKKTKRFIPLCEECGSEMEYQICFECEGKGWIRVALVFKKGCEVCDGAGSYWVCPNVDSHFDDLLDETSLLPSQRALRPETGAGASQNRITSLMKKYSEPKPIPTQPKPIFNPNKKSNIPFVPPPWHPANPNTNNPMHPRSPWNPNNPMSRLNPNNPNNPNSWRNPANPNNPLNRNKPFKK